jgi:hypothetical protein
MTDAPVFDRQRALLSALEQRLSKGTIPFAQWRALWDRALAAKTVAEIQAAEKAFRKVKE